MERLFWSRNTETQRTRRVGGGDAPGPDQKAIELLKQVRLLLVTTACS
eukprot:COSAG01_NODE_3715_length_5769_cov_2.903175_10_plen_48_part_00